VNQANESLADARSHLAKAKQFSAGSEMNMYHLQQAQSQASIAIAEALIDAVRGLHAIASKP
jgi:hypothetical protein